MHGYCQFDAMVAGAREEDVGIDEHAHDGVIVQLLLVVGFVGEHLGEEYVSFGPCRKNSNLFF